MTFEVSSIKAYRLSQTAHIPGMIRAMDESKLGRQVCVIYFLAVSQLTENTTGTSSIYEYASTPRFVEYSAIFSLHILRET